MNQYNTIRFLNYQLLIFSTRYESYICRKILVK